MAHISISNTKLGAIPTVNLPPIITCRKDAPCAKNCYACKGRFRFKNVQESMLFNLSEWQNNPGEYERSVMDACVHYKFFRWHSAGDIPDMDYFNMMIHIAKAVPDTKFLCFTKQYELVNNVIATNGYRFAICDGNGIFPPNLTIVFSAWGNNLPDNPFRFPVAYVRLKSGEGAEFIPEDAIRCPGYCADCVKHDQNCWNLWFSQSVVFNQH